MYVCSLARSLIRLILVRDSRCVLAVSSGAYLQGVLLPNIESTLVCTRDTVQATLNLSLKLYFPIFGKNTNSVCLRFATCHRATGFFFFLLFFFSVWRVQFCSTSFICSKTYIILLKTKSKILNQPSYHGIKSTMAIPNIHVIHRCHR